MLPLKMGVQGEEKKGRRAKQVYKKPVGIPTPLPPPQQKMSRFFSVEGHLRALDWGTRRAEGCSAAVKPEGIK